MSTVETWLYVTPTTTTYRQVLVAAGTALAGGMSGIAVNDQPLTPGGALAGVEPFTLCAALAAGVLTGHLPDARLAILAANTTTRPAAPLLLAAAQLADITAGRFDLGLGAGYDRGQARAFGLRWSDSLATRYTWLHATLARLEHMEELPGTPFDEPPPNGDEGARAVVPAAPILSTVPVIVGGWGTRAVALAGHPRVAEFNVPFLAGPATVYRWAGARYARRAGNPLRMSAAVNVAVAPLRDADQPWPGPGGPRQHCVTGTAEQVAMALAGYANAGADRLYLRPGDITDLPHLDRLVGEVLPALRELAPAVPAGERA